MDDRNLERRVEQLWNGRHDHNGQTFGAQIESVQVFAESGMDDLAGRMSDIEVIADDGLVPSAPAPPTLAGNPLYIQVSHDLGVAGGGTFNLEYDLDHLNVYASTSTGFTPGAANLLGQIAANNGHLILGITVIGTFEMPSATQRFVVVTAVDKVGNESPPSAEATVTATLINTAHITNAAITTAKIGDAQITNAKINDLSAVKITAGTLNADRVAAKSLSFEKLYLGSPDNLIQNPGFETGLFNPHATTAPSGSWVISTSGPRSGANLARYDFAGALASDAALTFNGSLLLNNHVDAAEGDVFYLTGWSRHISLNGTGEVDLMIRFHDAVNTLLSSPSTRVAVTTTYQQVEVEATAPAGTAYVAFQARVDNTSTATTGSIRFDDFYARRKVGTLIIEDQAIDIARMLDPVHADADEATPAGNVTLTTTLTEFANFDFTIPTWVGNATVFGVAGGQVSNNSGSNENLTVSCRIGDLNDGDFGGTAANGTSIVISHFEERTISAPGSTIQVSIYAGATGGMTPNVMTCWGTITGTR